MQFGPEMRSPCLSDKRQQRLRALLAFGVAAFAELRGIDQRAFQAVAPRASASVSTTAAVGMMVSARSTGFGDRREIRIDRPAPQLAALRIDQIELRREAGEFEVVVDFLDPAAAAGIGCADERDGFRTQQIVDGTKHTTTRTSGLCPLWARDQPTQYVRQHARFGLGCQGVRRIVGPLFGIGSIDRHAKDRL